MLAYYLLGILFVAWIVMVLYALRLARGVAKAHTQGRAEEKILAEQQSVIRSELAYNRGMVDGTRVEGRYYKRQKAIRKSNKKNRGAY